MFKRNNWQEKAIEGIESAYRNEQTRLTVKWSVKKMIEGEGMKYDDAYRQDSYHSALEKAQRDILAGKVIYIPGSQIIITKKGYIPFRAYLCKLARYAYYDNFRRKNELPTIRLSEDNTEYIEYNMSLRRNGQDILQDKEFKLYVSQSFTEKHREIIRLLIEGYSSIEIAKKAGITPQWVRVLKKRIGHEIMKS